MKFRDINIDCVKGFLIVLVVLGHVLDSLNLKFINYIYLFHMPSFIILSGMCYKKKSIIQNIIKTYIPFIVYLILIYLYSRVFLYSTPYKYLLVGGSQLGGVFGVFWFIPALFYAKILFGMINSIKIKNIYKFFIILALYVVNILILKIFTYNRVIFWNLDISFICLLYYSIGYFIKDNKDNKYLLIISLILVILVTTLWGFDLLKITFNMKAKSLFYNPIIQVIFPFAMTVVLIKIFSFIKNKNIIKQIFSYLGKSSLIIMYLHIPIFYTIKVYTSISYFLQIVIAIIVPILFFVLFSKNKNLKKIFIG